MSCLSLLIHPNTSLPRAQQRVTAVNVPLSPLWSRAHSHDNSAVLLTHLTTLRVSPQAASMTDFLHIQFWHLLPTAGCGAWTNQNTRSRNDLAVLRYPMLPSRRRIRPILHILPKIETSLYVAPTHYPHPLRVIWFDTQTRTSTSPSLYLVPCLLLALLLSYCIIKTSPYTTLTNRTRHLIRYGARTRTRIPLLTPNLALSLSLISLI